MTPTSSASPTFVVGIGASAGALPACKELLRALPPTTGMAFVIVCHLRPDYDSQLANLLSKGTQLKVSTAEHGESVLPNHVYVVPPNADLQLQGSAFKIDSPRGQRLNQIDLFFASLANAVGARAISIVLTGYGSDGAAGSRAVKAGGGTTFAQDETAEVGAMPLAARATGAIDFVLPIPKIADELRALAQVATTR